MHIVLSTITHVYVYSCNKSCRLTAMQTACMHNEGTPVYLIKMYSLHKLINQSAPNLSYANLSDRVCT